MCFCYVLGKFLRSWRLNMVQSLNPDKIRAIIEMTSSKTMEVQSLIRNVAALNIFVSKVTEKCLPFFNVLRKAFQWIDKYEEALTKLNREEERLQKPMYYTSLAFQGAEAKYTRLEKIAFALVIAQRKLPPYFQALPIIVITDQPIREMMSQVNSTQNTGHGL